MSERHPPASWWFVSDLHLDPDGGDPHGVEPAFASFVEEVVRRGRRGSRNLVLLGDTLELRRHDGEVPPTERLCAAASSFPGVFGALRDALADGVSVHAVCGNHDYPLAGPACRTTLARLLDRGAGAGSLQSGRAGTFQVHPWLLHRPGLFYAEHGNQHHELNRLPELVSAGVAPDGEWLPDTVLEAWSRCRASGAGPFAGSRALLAALAAAARAERVAAGEGHQALVDGLSVLQQLPPPVLRDLHALGAATPAVGLARTSRRVTLRALGHHDHDSYLRRAARSVDAVLRANGLPVPCYLFGHSHVEALEPLGPPRTWYANTGTWSGDVRGPHADGGGSFPFVALEVTPGRERDEQPGVEVLLMHWDPVARTARRVPLP